MDGCGTEDNLPTECSFIFDIGISIWMLWGRTATDRPDTIFRSMSIGILACFIHNTVVFFVQRSTKEFLGEYFLAYRCENRTFHLNLSVTDSSDFSIYSRILWKAAKKSVDTSYDKNAPWYLYFIKSFALTPIVFHMTKFSMDMCIEKCYKFSYILISNINI